MRLFLFCTCVFAIFLTGCGQSTSGVSGNVVANGEKVTSGNITFAPVGGGGKPVTAIIKEDGTYSITGATAGKSTAVFAPATSTEPVALTPGEFAKPAPYAGYSVKAPEIELKSGQNTIDIELTGPKQ